MKLKNLQFKDELIYSNDSFNARRQFISYTSFYDKVNDQLLYRTSLHYSPYYWTYYITH